MQNEALSILVWDKHGKENCLTVHTVMVLTTPVREAVFIYVVAHEGSKTGLLVFFKYFTVGNFKYILK